MSAVRLADHDAIMRQSLALCEAQLYQQFHAALANTRRERARNAAAQLEAAKQQAQAELRSVPMEQLPSADAVQSLQADAARALRAEEEEHARLQRDMYTRMAEHVAAKAAQEEQYDQLCIQRAQQQQRETQERLRQIIGSNIAAQAQEQASHPDDADADADASASDAASSNHVAHQSGHTTSNSASSPALRSRRSEMRSEARQMRGTAAEATSHTADAATATVPSLIAAAAPAHAASTSATPRSARPESAPVHPQSQRSSGRDQSPTAAAATSQKAPRSRPRTAAKRTVDFSTTDAGNARSGSSSPARARSRPASSSPPPPLLSPHTPLALGDSLLDASSVQTLIASVNSALALADRRYRVLPDRFRAGTPFGLPGERKQGHTRYARGILYSEGLGLSNVSKAVRQKLARKEAAVLAEVLRKNELERVLAEKKAQEALHASASMLEPNDQHSAAVAAAVEIKGLDSSTLMPVAAAAPVATAADRRRVEMEAEAARLAAADARAESRRKTRRATALPLPIVMPDGQTVDAATHAPLAPLLDYASFAQSPAEKLQARLKEDERLEQEKQKRIDLKWTHKQRRASTGPGTGGAASPTNLAASADQDSQRLAESDVSVRSPAAVASASSNEVDSVALYLNKSSVSLDEVQRMRSAALSPLLGSSSRKTLNSTMHQIQQREQQQRRRATLGSAQHARHHPNGAVAGVTDRTQSPSPPRSSSRLEGSSRSTSAERRASGRPPSVERAVSFRSVPDASSAAAVADSSTDLRPETLIRVSSFKGLSPSSSQRSSAAPSRSTSSLAMRPQQHVRKPSAEELRLPLPSSMLATIQGSPNKDAPSADAHADHTVRSSVFGNDTAVSSKDNTPRELQQTPSTAGRQLASSRSQPGLSHRSQQDSPAVTSSVAVASPARSSSRSSSAMGSVGRHRAQLSLQVEEPEWMTTSAADETGTSVRTTTTADALVDAANLTTTSRPGSSEEPEHRTDAADAPAASSDAAESSPYDLMQVWPHDRDGRGGVDPAERNENDDDDSSGVSEDSAGEEEEQHHAAADESASEQSNLPLTPAQTDTAAFSSMFEQVDDSRSSSQLQQPRQLRPSSRDSRSCPDTSQPPRFDPQPLIDAPSDDSNGPSPIDITLASLRSTFAKARRRCESVRADLLRAQRERDVQREQLAHADLLRADRSEWQRAEVMALTDCAPAVIATTSSSTGEPLRRAPRDGESYSASDHQLNLLYFHNLLYAALKEEKDLRFLRDHLIAEEQRMQAAQKQDAARLAQTTQRTLDAKQAHLWTLQAEQKKVVGLLGQYERQSQSVAEILRTARELTRFWGQVQGFEREAPTAISVASATMPAAKNQNGRQDDMLTQLSKNARTNNPLLPSCMRCHRALLPSAQDEALRLKLVAQKREGIKTHAALFELQQAQGDTGAASAAPSLSAAPRSRPHSAMPLHPTSSLLPGASTTSLRSSASSLSSAGAAALGVAKGARTEWAMLEQLAALSKTMSAAQKSGADRSTSTAAARAAVVKSELGIPATKQDRIRMARDQNAARFRGASMLRPQSAAAHAPSNPMSGSNEAAHHQHPPRAQNRVSVDGLAAARQLQQQLLARERLHSHCDHFTHMLSGRSVCRACRYALEAMPPAPLRAFDAFEEKQSSSSPSASRTGSPPPRAAPAASATALNSLFVPNQTALRFFEQRRLVNLEDTDGKRGRTQQQSTAGRPASAASNAASRPQSALQQQQQPSPASGDTLSLLQQLRSLLGFHAQRSQPSSGSQYRAAQKMRAGDASGQHALPVHDAPNPVLRSGIVALANLMQCAPN